MPTLDFWFDYSCPYAYLGSTQVERLARLMDATLTFKPMLLGGVFEANSVPQNLAQSLVPAKASHTGIDMLRWADLFGVPLTPPPSHPQRTVEALRATLATACDPKVIHGFYRAYWVDGRPVSDSVTIRDVVSAAGHDAEVVLTRVATSEIKEDLRRRTDEAVALGIFGAPAYMVNGTDLYWGQDRMHFVAGKRLDEVLPPLPRAKPRHAHTLDIYWDFSSPFAYLGSTQAEALAVRTGAALAWHPMLLGGLFKQVGQPMVPMQTWSPAKQRHVFQDFQRWADYWGVPFSFPSNFPINSIKPLRCYLALPEGERGEFRARTFAACWAKGEDITDDAVLRQLLGVGADRVLAAAQTPEIKQALIQATERAAKIGAFGAPTWVVDGSDLYWGQDRIPLVERALLR
jgi:2-hydroxychromene-2-carboxylate isomerase